MLGWQQHCFYYEITLYMAIFLTMKAVIYYGVLSLMSQKCYKASEFDARKPKPTRSLQHRKQI